MNVETAALLVLAGIGGGLSGSIAGLASLVSYPALLAVGLPPTSANVTNTIALVFSGLGTLLGSRPELRGQGALVRKLLCWAVPGGIAGGVLLLITPSEVLERLVPFLIGGAALAVLVRTGPSAAVSAEGEAGPDSEGVAGSEAEAEALADLPAGRIPHTAADLDPHPPLITPSRVLLVSTFFVGIYSGYFGAAAGVMLVALLLALTPLGLARASAVRTTVLTAANLVAAVWFTLFGPVDWLHCVPLAVGFLIGGRIGPLVLRHAPAGPLRVLIALAGLGLAVQLAVQAFF
ncbi:sulfite exporter TauE/SafE family protein [Kineosporia sp. J2-2]|uniref:Probable membrane transporter protein n=1 Tax=Kineosporia corallincola TaxID=2835133 RepID=A0ABS5T905_9ACTN|nr:sulfite exporter TauE/SafE family protein [Kineosporia corallincola]MBT0767535.1 sulfite exporter TauE/SafE family protein [Kineosporia corallincola]